MKLSRETKVASSLLAKAFIAARSGDEEKAGAYMMAACRTDALDPVMHGIAASMGIDEADYDDDEMEAGCENGECCASDEDDYDDIEAADEDEDEDDAEEVEFGEVEFDEEEDEDEDAEDGEAEKKPVGVSASAEKPSKVAVPASCYRLARARY